MVVATVKHTKDQTHKETLEKVMSGKNKIMQWVRDYRKEKNKTYIGKCFEY
jgi:ribosomal protein S15P/S13E